MSAELSFAPNTKEIQCDVNSRMLRSRYAELAYCRMMLCRATARQDEVRIKFYREDAERARRCVDSLLKPRGTGRVVFPEIQVEVSRWAEVSRRREMPW